MLKLADAIDRMTLLPASTFGFASRGRVGEGYFADLTVFDPDTVEDRATFADPHRLAIGVSDVVINGAPAVRDGVSTGQLAGRAVYGPGRRR